MSWPAVKAFACGAAVGLGYSAAALLVLIIAAAAVTYFQLRKQEDQDAVDDLAPDRATVAAIFERENRCAQNHMISVTRRKPGIVRWFTARLIFWAIGELASKVYKPGFLSDIGTIHFARWVTVPGSRDLLFLSNYDASWESYLEDFITRAHQGLTGVWSNSMGFPRSENLIEKGATDGERFKRYARRSMVPTRFWYSAYPMLTTTAIRTNADIRRGLSGVMTEDEAQRWLALFGSAARPASRLVNSEIQSLIFGGLKFMPAGVCLLFRLPDDVAKARTWLKSLVPHIAFNDGRKLRAEAIITLALGASGLRRLGLAEEGLATFPFAFLEGMTAEYRARILGDGPADGKWAWDDRRFDAALLLYGTTAEAVSALEKTVRAGAKTSGMGKCHVNPACRSQEGEQDRTVRLRGRHIAAGHPRALIRGYATRIRSISSSPASSSLDTRTTVAMSRQGRRCRRSPTRKTGFLSWKQGMILPRRRWTYSAISARTEASWSFDSSSRTSKGLKATARDESERLADRFPAPYEMSADFIAAKMVGRWKDGSSLVRHVYSSKTEEVMRHRSNETVRPEAKTASAAPQSPAVRRRAPAIRRTACVPTTTSCSVRRTPKACDVRSAPTSGGPTRATVSIRALPTKSPLQTGIASCVSDAFIRRRKATIRDCCSCASTATSNASSSSSSRPG